MNTAKSTAWTIPNTLSIARLVFLVPFVCVALNDPIAGAIFISILASTDFLDGWIARRFHQESEFGRIIDPIADRALTLTGFITFIITGSLPLWFVLLVGIREVAVTLGTGYIFLKKHIRLDVNLSGKVSAFGAMVAIPCWVISGETATSPHAFWTLVALVASCISIPAGYYSLIEYVRAYKSA